MRRTTPEAVEILDAVDVPIVVVDRECLLIRFNRAAAEAFSLIAADIGRLPSAVTAFAHLKTLVTQCAQVIADEAPFRRDIRSGDRQFLLRIAPHRRENVQVVGAVLTFTNVTAFRASIDQAVYEREHTKALLNTFSHPLVVLDSDLRVQSANRAFYSFFGYSRDETQNVSLRDLGDDDWRNLELWSSLAAISTDGESGLDPIELDRNFSTLGTRTFLLDARRVSREGDSAILVTFQDITERKHAEKTLRQHTAQFETLLNRAPLGVYVVGSDLRIQQVNPTARPVFGDAPDLIGRDFGTVIHELWPKQYAAEIVQRFERTLETGEPYFTPERVAQRLDTGAIEYYEWRIERLPLPDGRNGVVCYFRDISAQVLARQKIQESDRQFRQLADAMPQIVWTARPDGHIDYFNERWYEFSGLPRDQFGIQSWEPLLHAEDAQQTIRPFLPLRPRAHAVPNRMSFQRPQARRLSMVHGTSAARPKRRGRNCEVVRHMYGHR